MFQCSSASRKFLNVDRSRQRVDGRVVSVLFSEPKIPQSQGLQRRPANVQVSVLFSEPKIPQSCRQGKDLFDVELFQCSSASRKFLNMQRWRKHRCRRMRFSALQRAENSSIIRSTSSRQRAYPFQCSSASRKFLNPDPRTCVHPYFRPR